MSRHGVAPIHGLVLLGLLTGLSSLTDAGAFAGGGAASGNVAVVDAGTKAYGYSGYSGTWTAADLDAPAETRLAGDNLGYVRTSSRVHSFNPTNSRWYGSAYSGNALGESTLGATSIFWSTHAAYAIASLWSIWRDHPWEAGEVPQGGGSCGCFALVWTQHHAHAFHSASGQWMTQPLEQPISGGITCQDFGLVWTPQTVYSFDPFPGGWVPLALGFTHGISVTGEGNVALAWSADHAEAYSGTFDAWFPADGSSPILDGIARGNLALFWSASDAWVFDASTGLWSGVEIEGGSAGAMEPLEPGSLESGLAVRPNPAVGDQIQFELPGGPTWEVEIFDVTGRQVRSLRPADATSPHRIEWNRTDETGLRVPAGMYWVRARSEEAVEVRRLSLWN